MANIIFVMSLSPAPFGAHAAALLVCGAVPCFHSAAQTTAPAAPATPATPAEVVLITATPYGSNRSTAPVSVLTGEALVLRRAGSLGDTLSGLPGVSATGFGPNASRPVLRGLDGDRVRILNNAGGSVDASALSFDHAVPIDPLIVTRLEVLRGPAALMHGGSALGGVVNAIDNRIPAERLGSLGGAAELRLGGASRERAAVAWLEGGSARVGSTTRTITGDTPAADLTATAPASTPGSMAWHVDAFGRSTGNQRAPLHEPREADGTLLPAIREQRNSAARTSGAAVGGAWFAGGTRLGLALDHYESRYGVVAEPDVRIAMQRHQLALAADWANLGPAQTVQVQGHSSRYQHQELDGAGRVGTEFSSQGQELRLQVKLQPLAGGSGLSSVSGVGEGSGLSGPVGAGGLGGLWGLHLENSRFSALGAEAFVPSTHTRKAALFTLQEGAWGGTQWAAGARLESAQVGSAGDGVDVAAAAAVDGPQTSSAPGPRFGAPVQRRFWLRSAALSLEQAWGPIWAASASISHTERAPTYFELFANGVHAATGSYERGDTSLQREQAQNIELALRGRQGHALFRLGLFFTNFQRYVQLASAGQWVDEAGPTRPAPAAGETAVPLYRFEPIRAQWAGAELEARSRLWQGPGSLDASFKLDTVRGRNTSNGQPLPRVPPLRLRFGLEGEWQAWHAHWELDHAARQSRIPDTDSATASYTLMNVLLARRLRWGEGEGLAYLRVNNLGNRLAYNAAATPSIRSLSPLAARAVAAGLRVSF
jgi:iron complex outermembrane recepter protein